MLLWIFALVSLSFGLGAGIAWGWPLGLGFFLKALALGIGTFVGLILAFALLVALSAAFIDPTRPCEKDSPYYRWLTNQVMLLGVVFGRIRIHVTGLEKVPRQGRFLLVINHLFDLDPLVILRVLKDRQLAFVSKKENDRIPIVGKVMHKILCLPIDRENDREALKTIVKAISYLKEDKVSMAIFPEGYVSKTGQLQPFRNGAFKIAQKAQVPMVVAVLHNTQAIGKNMFRRTTHVHLDFLQTLQPAELTGVATKEVGDRVHRLMEQGLSHYEG